MKKKGLLFLNGIAPEARELERLTKARANAAVYCTDGAYEYLSRYFLPDVVVGDFDSLDRARVDSGCEVLGFPADKDYTDGFLAVKIMAERGITDIDIYGAYGARPDMAESNYLLLALAKRVGVKARLCGDFFTYLCDGTFSAEVKKGATVSVVPFGDYAHILYTKGLKYALSDHVMRKFDGVEKPDYVMGVSNVACADCVEIAFGGGAALVFIQQIGR